MSMRILHTEPLLVSFSSSEAGRTYRRLKPNEHGRLAIEELDVEATLLDEWVRFWHKRGLLPLPAEEELQRLLAQLEQLRRGERGHP